MWKQSITALFDECCSLTDITIPGSVKTIGERAFYECFHLCNVTISPGTTTIGELAFGRCEGMRRVSIPDSVTSIGENAFSIDVCWSPKPIPNISLTLYCSRGSYAEQFWMMNPGLGIICPGEDD